jgi:uncharacterized membrane protein
MQEIIKALAQYAALFAEAIAVFFIIFGIAGALLIYIRKTYFARIDYRVMVASRIHLGHSLSIALEFLIGADILKTAISPTWQDIGQLGAIVGIRTVLNYFLSKELREMETHETH